MQGEGAERAIELDAAEAAEAAELRSPSSASSSSSSSRLYSASTSSSTALGFGLGGHLSQLGASAVSSVTEAMGRQWGRQVRIFKL